MPIPGGTGPALVTLTDVHAELNYPAGTVVDDNELQGFIDAATDVITDEVGDALPTTYTELHDGGQPKIVLRHYPVLTITSITEYTPAAQALANEPLDSTGTFTGYGYTAALDIGVITRTSGGQPYRFTTGQVEIIYTAGLAAIPASVRRATLELIAHWWQAGQQGSAQSPGQVAGAGSYDAVDTVEPYRAGVPYRILELLKPYRRAPRIG